MRSVAREAFVEEDLRRFAYADEPLPIGAGQTISQPYMVAAMTEALRLQGGENVLEIGTGSGYAAAVLAHIAREVHTIERIPALADHARATLRRLGYHTVYVVEGEALSAGPPALPTTPSSPPPRDHAFLRPCAPS